MATTLNEVQELKERGNTCVRECKFEEALIRYTHAIKLEPNNYSLYSNRSFAFLKLQQHYFAMEDALQTIRLKPDWVKGYFRKGEVEFSAFHFAEAIVSYSHALQLQPGDPTITEALSRTTRQYHNEKRADDQIPWLGAGIGIILGVAIVIADYLLTTKPSLSHPVLMALLTIAVAMIGYGLARACRYYVTCQRTGLLEPPLDHLLPSEPENSAEESCGPSTERNYTRYSKAQARQRFKKGRS